MSYSKLIHEYLDGQLEQAEEEALFDQLARDPVLRSEFNQQMKLTVAAQADMGTITPPIDSTNMIFSSLGFSIPSADYMNKVNEAIDPVNAGKAAWNTVKKYGVIVATAVISIAVTSMLFMYMNWQDSLVSRNIAQQVKPSIPVLKSFEQSNLSAESTQKAAQPERNNTQSTVRSIPSSIRQAGSGTTVIADNSPVQDSKSNSASIINNNDGNSAFINTAALSASNFPVRKINNRTGQLGSLILFNPQTKENIPFGNAVSNPDFSVVVRTFAANSNPKPAIVSTSGLDLSNLSVSILYNFDKHFSIGFEGGRENFVQVYTNADGSFTNQNPAVFWGGFTLCLAAPELSLFNIMPYVQGFAGITRIYDTYLYKYQAGLQYAPESVLSINLGIEGTSLTYKVPNELDRKFTKKVGITAGVAVNLDIFR